MGEVVTKGIVNGVEISPLKQIIDARGAVFHMLKASSDKNLLEIGEVYFSYVKSGVVKAWKKHKIMRQQFAIPAGEIKLVIFDGREDSPTRGNVKEITTGIHKYALIKIPAGVWYGFKGVSTEDAMIVNCASHLHDPEEVERLPDNSSLIPYQW